MKRSRAVVVCGAIAVLVGMAFLGWWLALGPVSLPQWVERVRRPGYRLLFATETPDQSYYAIFDAGDDKLAFCHRHRPGHHYSSSLTISAVGGKDVLDTKHRRFTVLTRKVLGFYGVIDGEEYPIKPGVVGPLGLRFLPTGAEELYADIPWDPVTEP